MLGGPQGRLSRRQHLSTARCYRSHSGLEKRLIKDYAPATAGGTCL
jgi:hypothetical protein